jgi:hypothetical protein
MNEELPPIVMRTQLLTTTERALETNLELNRKRALVYRRRIKILDEARRRGGSILDAARAASTPEAAERVRVMLARASGASAGTRRKVEMALAARGFVPSVYPHRLSPMVMVSFDPGFDPTRGDR